MLFFRSVQFEFVAVVTTLVILLAQRMGIRLFVTDTVAVHHPMPHRPPGGKMPRGLSLSGDIVSSYRGRERYGQWAARPYNSPPSVIDSALNGANPWSWYMASTPSKCSYVRFPKKNRRPHKGRNRRRLLSPYPGRAGRIISLSSVPNRPSSPAWGFNANTAIRGFDTLKSLRSASWKIRIFALRLPWLSPAPRRGSANVVTKATRSTSFIKIISASRPSPARSCIYSVCPGKWKPSP